MLQTVGTNLCGRRSFLHDFFPLDPPSFLRWVPPDFLVLDPPAAAACPDHKIGSGARPCTVRPQITNGRAPCREERSRWTGIKRSSGCWPAGAAYGRSRERCCVRVSWSGRSETACAARQISPGASRIRCGCRRSIGPISSTSSAWAVR